MGLFSQLRKSVRLNLEQLEDRTCPTTHIGDTITVSATINTTDVNEAGEGENPVLTIESTGGFHDSISGFGTSKIFQFQAKVLGEQVGFKLSGDDGDETPIVNVAVNGVKVLNANEKSDLANTGYTLTQVGAGEVIVGGLIAGIAGLATGGAAWVAFGIGFGTMGGLGAMYGSKLQHDASNDPSDPNFRHVVKPQVFHTPQFKAQHGALNKTEATALNALLKNEGMIMGTVDALFTTVNRVEGAFDAGQKRFIKLQEKAATKYRLQLAHLLQNDVKFRQKFSKALQKGGITFTGVTTDQVIQLENQISSSGLPATVLAALNAIHADADTIANIKNVWITTSAEDVAKLSHDPFADPTVLQALNTTAQALIHNM
jgi:hypothetical protein